MIYQPDVNKTFKHYEEGITRGLEVGFRCMQEVFSLKKGTTLYVMGAPFSGKSEFTLELLVYLSETYGWKHLIYTPETGDPVEIVAELSSKYIQKDFYKGYDNQMDTNEMYRATEWVDEHFTIVDFKEAITPQEFYELANEIEDEYNVNFNTTLIDPWNEMKHAKGRYRDDEYLDDILSFIRKNARNHNRINIITTHCRDQQLVRDGDLFYYPMPSPRDYAMGQTWYRKGMAMIGVWRPPAELGAMRIENLRDAEPYGEHATVISIQKAKPKGVAEPGKLNKNVVLYYDAKKHRYYENYGTQRRFASRTESEGQPPQVDIRASGINEPPF